MSPKTSPRPRRRPRRFKLLSPAKINLCLRVTAKRRDGFHDIDSIFERIGLCDEIILESASKISLKTDSRALPKNASNLAVKAALLLKQKTGHPGGVTIHLKKRIPLEAGLGGGSSNAATVLLGLNQLWDLKLSRQKLLETAAEIGSDVPFFVLGTSFAHVQGRGEILKPLSWNLKLWHCIVKPPFGISTKKAYQNLHPRLLQAVGLTPPMADVKLLVPSLKKGDKKTLLKQLFNTLEVSQVKGLTTIYDVKSELSRQGAFFSLMSGSGSSVFGLFKSRSAALKAGQFFKKKYPRWQVFTAKTY